MTSPQAIIVGAIIIAASIVFVNTIRPAEAQRIGPFQLMHHSNPTANAGVFRIDEGSGEVSYCYVTANSDLVCSKSIR
ncbi:MAG TPA: hypothetical protein VFR09_07775 [Alphaproteobacteria bacterium]|nr:hypothetical protein [Alphaproteobacteria bacterium]